MVLRNATNHSIQLEKWLIENRENIKNGTAEYDGLRVTPETKVAQFSYVFSALVLSIEFSGRRYFTDEHTVFAAIGASIYSLLFGILLIPLGPYYAVKAAYKNLVSGGVQTTVKELFAAMDKAAEEQAKKA